MYIKKKLWTCRIQIQVEKVWFFGKKSIFIIFSIFFFKGGTLWSRNWKNIYFNFSKFTKFFLKDDLNGTYKMFKETKSWSMSSFEVSTEDLQGIYGVVGKICPALPQIGQGTFAPYALHIKKISVAYQIRKEKHMAKFNNIFTLNHLKCIV